jgi:hypothetical protein
MMESHLDKVVLSSSEQMGEEASYMVTYGHKEVLFKSRGMRLIRVVFPQFSIITFATKG